MPIPFAEPAPFARGDRVVYRPRPAGPETVALVEWSPHGADGGGWYVGTVRQAGPTETRARRYDRAELFEPAGDPVPFFARGRCRQLLRRARLAAGGFLLLALALALGVLYGALVEIPS